MLETRPEGNFVAWPCPAGFLPCPFTAALHSRALHRAWWLWGGLCSHPHLRARGRKGRQRWCLGQARSARGGVLVFHRISWPTRGLPAVRCQMALFCFPAVCSRPRGAAEGTLYRACEAASRASPTRWARVAHRGLVWKSWRKLRV